MNQFFKKYVPVTIGALMATSPLFVSADMDARIGALEAKMKDAGTITARGDFGARTATDSPKIDGYGFDISADALLWKLYTDGGDDYALSTSTALAAGVIAGNVQTRSFNWDWGFRTGIGYYAEHDNWDTNLVFT